jgi:alpha-mannosidase
VFFNGQEHTLTQVQSKVVAEGPVLGRLEVTGTTEGISVTSLITVYAQLDRVDLDIRIHKPVTSEEQRLTQTFPLIADGAVERIETTGAVVRPFAQPAGDLLTGANPNEFAVQGFVDASTIDGSGVTIAPLDAFVLRQDLGAVTFEAVGNDQNYKEATRDQRGVTDFRLRYSLKAHHSGYDGAAVFAWSRSVATGIVARLGAVPEALLSQPTVEVDGSRAIATAFKAADGDGNLLRLWETAGKAGPITVAIPGYRRAIRTDLLERDLEPLAIDRGKLQLPLSARSFAAVRLLP